VAAAKRNLTSPQGKAEQPSAGLIQTENPSGRSGTFERFIIARRTPGRQLADLWTEPVPGFPQAGRESPRIYIDADNNCTSRTSSAE
jgi:hypothetical protein